MMLDLSADDRAIVAAAIARITPRIPDEFQGMAGPMMETTFAGIVQVGGAAALDQMILDLEEVQVALTTRNLARVQAIAEKYHVPSDVLAMVSNLIMSAEIADETGDASLEKLNPDYKGNQ